MASQLSSRTPVVVSACLASQTDAVPQQQDSRHSRGATFVAPGFFLKQRICRTWRLCARSIREIGSLAH